MPVEKFLLLRTKFGLSLPLKELPREESLLANITRKSLPINRMGGQMNPKIIRMFKTSATYVTKKWFFANVFDLMTFPFSNCFKRHSTDAAMVTPFVYVAQVKLL